MEDCSGLMSFVESFEQLMRTSNTIAWTGFRLRNEGSYFGVLWYLFEPLFLFFVLLSLRPVFVKEAIPYYPVYLLTGIIIFNFFSKATHYSVSLFSRNASLLKSTNIARESLVFGGVLQFLFSHFFEFLLLLVVSLLFGITPGWFFWYLLVLVAFVFFICGCCFILCVLGVYFNDLDNLWSVFMRLLWFLTPIFYIPPNNSIFLFFNFFNPLFYFITLFRASILGQFLFETFFVVLFFGLFFFFVGILFFNLFKYRIVERI